VCGIVAGTKSEDSSQIGRFGIGFKSVYSYTSSPEIYSANKSFKIENYVHPYSINKKEKMKQGETLFIIPFNHTKKNRKKSFDEIKSRLKHIGLETLLFLKNIYEIEWNIYEEEDKDSGCYFKEIYEINNDYKKVNIIGKKDANTEPNEESWIVFARSVEFEGNSLLVEIAYKTKVEKQKSGKEKTTIISSDNAKLSAFFLTDKDTYLKFIIQAPFRTTPARDNILIEDELNIYLINEIAELVSYSISKIKEIGLLDINFINTLPIIDYGDEDNIKYYIYNIIFNKVKEKFLSDESLLPDYQGGYIKSSQALLARGKDLIDLLTPGQLSMLFNRNDLVWLNDAITVDRNRELRKYLCHVFKVVLIPIFCGLLSEAHTIDDGFYKFENRS